MTRIQHRRGTAAQWVEVNPVLAQGEMGVETDTDKHKIGDGTTAWNGLGYFINESALSELVEEAIANIPRETVLLNVGQTASDVPAGTPVGTLIFRKAVIT